MKSSKIFMGLGATVLAVGAIMAGRASVKYSAPTKLFYTQAGLCKQAATSIGAVVGHLTTTGVANQAFILTGTAGKYKLFAATNGLGACITPVRFNP